MIKVKTNIFKKLTSCYSAEDLKEVSFMKKKEITIKDLFASEIPYDDKLYGLAMILYDQQISIDIFKREFEIKFDNGEAFQKVVYNYRILKIIDVRKADKLYQYIMNENFSQ